MNRRTMLGALLGMGGSSLRWNPTDSAFAEMFRNTEKTATYRFETAIHASATLEDVIADAKWAIERHLREDWVRRPASIR